MWGGGGLQTYVLSFFNCPKTIGQVLAVVVGVTFLNVFKTE